MPVTNHKMIERNIELSAEFSRYLFDHPDLGETIPQDSEIVFLPEFDNDLKSFNLKLGKNLQASGTPVVYIKIKKLRPKILSRIEGVSVKVGGNNRLKRI
jgi:hypothetical protein